MEDTGKTIALIKAFGGRGSALPPITASDNGKVLTVNVTKEKGAVIVPQQSVNVTFGPPAQLSNTVDDLFAEGAKVIMTVDGVEYAATVENINGTRRAIYNGDGIQVNFAMSLGHVSIGSPIGTHTVSMNLDDSSVGWAAKTPGGGGSGGRFVVTFSYDEATETWSADKTFAECVAAWNAGQNLFALAEATYFPMSSLMTDDGEVTYIAFYSADAESKTVSGYCIDAEGAYYYGN